MHWILAVRISACIIILIGGLLGNISAILTVALNKSMRNTINLYIANLALADAMTCVFCVVPFTLDSFFVYRVMFDAFMCKFEFFARIICLTSSVLTLSAISCDRFVAVMFPFRVRIMKKRTSLAVTIIWIVSIVVAVPLFIVGKPVAIQWKDSSEKTCYEERSRDFEFYRILHFVYYVFLGVILFFLPVLIMITAYSMILRRLWTTEVPGEKQATNDDARSRARKKVNKMIFATLVAFIICWTPFQVIVLYPIILSLEQSHVRHRFLWFAECMAYANSFLNPFIYGGFNKNYREGLWTILRCGYRRHKKPARRKMFSVREKWKPPPNIPEALSGTYKASSQEFNMLTELKVPVFHGDLSATVKEGIVSIANAKETDEIS